MLLNQPVENYNGFPLPPLKSRIFNVLLIGGLVLVLSCQSEQIIINPPGGYEYISKTFQLDTENSYSIQGDAHTGYSPRLYSGTLINGNMVSALIRLLPDVLSPSTICDDSSVYVRDVKLELVSTSTIAVIDDTTFIDTLIQWDAFEAFIIPPYVIEEDDSITGVILSEIMDLPMDTLSVSLKTNNSIEINLFKHDSTIISRWCETKEELGIIVSYSPTDSSYLEFYSSDGTEVGLGPKLSLEYAVDEEISTSYNLYSINSVIWSGDFGNLNFGPYYVNDSLSDDWGTFYAIDLNLEGPIISNSSTFYDSIAVQSDIIPEVLTSLTQLLQIKVELNSEIINEIDSITLSLTDAIAFRSDVDPAGDNVETHPDSTENNKAYDEGEIFNDYGLDKCPDEMELGNGECAASEEESAFNSIGTERNKLRDWTDYNGNGKWDPNEGEEWGDWGFDWCPDSLENGEGGCLIEPPDSPLGYDPNEDNIDSVGDDWHEINNPDGTEGNHKWDPGEPFYDWGSDGLPESLIGYIDEMEDNNVYNEGEPFDDTGSDGLYNENEPGYNTNRTEGNDKFDDEGEFNDCGKDNCCDPKDDENERICNDAPDDNYNIDPNEDNWNDCGSDQICPSSNSYTAEDPDGTEGNENWDENEGMEKNIVLDWTDAINENGVWDDGEGEEWFDWGLDGIHDMLEAFQVSVIPPNLYDNNYVFDISSELLSESPELVDSTVNLWISKIEKTNDNELTIDISIQSNVALKGLEFQLSHIPYTRVDTLPQIYEPSIEQIGTEKLFEDLSLLPKKMYSEEELDEKMLIDYANDVSTFLDFDGLDIFLADEENIISHEYSDIVMYVDYINTNIYDNMWVYITHENSSGEDEILSLPIVVSSLSDSIKFSMGYILGAYQSGNLGIYDQFKIQAGGSFYNYSLLSIQNNPRLDIMYTK